MCVLTIKAGINAIKYIIKQIVPLLSPRQSSFEMMTLVNFPAI